ncbi:MAG: hypothetical protein FJ306_11845 [Planctomycetes bacterium]|nr:hypothetical protein [Planctomycetota bacterium]
MTLRPQFRRAAFGALLLAGCATAPPVPDRLELATAPLLAVAAPASDRVVVVLRDATLVVLDAAAMQANTIDGTAPMAPTCAAVDAAGWLAIGGNDGTALLLDANAPNWERAIALAARQRPLTAIGLLAAVDARATADGNDAPPVDAHALIAGFPADLQSAHVVRSHPASDATTTPATPTATVALRPIAPAPAHTRAIAVDPVARRWYVLADGAITNVDAEATPTPRQPRAEAAAKAGAGATADTRTPPPPAFVLAAPSAHALAWSGSALVVADDDGVRCHDPRTGVAPALPAAEGTRLTHIVASDALGAIAALDEAGALWLWRRRGDAWQRVPTPHDLPPARSLVFAEPSRRLLVFCGTAAAPVGAVHRIDVPPLPPPAP